MTTKQKKYLELSGSKVIKVDREGWMLVEFKPEVEAVALGAALEQELQGDKVQLADVAVWVDPEGREHFGPGETGYDRFNLNEGG